MTDEDARLWREETGTPDFDEPPKPRGTRAGIGNGGRPVRKMYTSKLDPRLLKYLQTRGGIGDIIEAWANQCAPEWRDTPIDEPNGRG